MSGTRIYRHENGYSATLYGNSSMIIYHDGKEVMHTGFRNVNTEAEVMKMLEEMSEFWSNILGIR